MDSHAERLHWPFFGEEHRRLAAEAEDWAAANLAGGAHAEDRAAVDARCRELVAALGKAGFLKHCLRAADGGAAAELDARSICLLRETFARHDPLADFALAMQGLGSAPLSLAGGAEMRKLWLPRVGAGSSIAAFALSEPGAGSDVAAMETTARLDGPQYVLDGQKTWISNGGIADFYVVFARTKPGVRRPDGSVSAEGISAFLVKPGDSGFTVAERIDAMAPHPLGRLAFEDCRIPVARLVGTEGEGFKIAMRTLDVFRTSVAAAALGFARRALREALAHARERSMFGKTLADLQLTQAALAEMATQVDAAALLVYRAAWLRDRGNVVTKEAAMAKLAATESAQRVIDRAVQMFGGRGVRRGEVVERLYREIRALRIYEGATEVQQLIIGRELLKE
jgi:acyl-CoA dehydrogenase